MSDAMAIANAWASAELLGWEVVALVRHVSAPEARWWRAELVSGHRRAHAFGPTAEAALLLALLNASAKEIAASVISS